MLDVRDWAFGERLRFLLRQPEWIFMRQACYRPYHSTVDVLVEEKNAAMGMDRGVVFVSAGGVFCQKGFGG